MSRISYLQSINCNPGTITINNFSVEKTQLAKINHVLPCIDGPPIYEQVHHASNFIMFSNKKEALDYLLNYNTNSGLKLFSEDVNSTGVKKFLLVTCEHIYYRIINTRAHLYENIERGQPVKLHIDLDYKTRISNILKLNKLFARLVHEALELFNKALVYYGVVDPQIIILKSNQVTNQSGENKVSGHIIYNNVVFADTVIVKKNWAQI